MRKINQRNVFYNFMIKMLLKLHKFLYLYINIYRYKDISKQVMKN